MGRYVTEHHLVDTSIIPFIPMYAKESVTKDTVTGNVGKGYDWNSYAKAEDKAWQKLQDENNRSGH